MRDFLWSGFMPKTASAPKEGARLATRDAAVVNLHHRLRLFQLATLAGLHKMQDHSSICNNLTSTSRYLLKESNDPQVLTLLDGEKEISAIIGQDLQTVTCSLEQLTGVVGKTLDALSSEIRAMLNNETTSLKLNCENLLKLYIELLQQYRGELTTCYNAYKFKPVTEEIYAQVSAKFPNYMDDYDTFIQMLEFNRKLMNVLMRLPPLEAGMHLRAEYGPDGPKVELTGIPPDPNVEPPRKPNGWNAARMVEAAEQLNAFLQYAEASIMTLIERFNVLLSMEPSRGPYPTSMQSGRDGLYTFLTSLFTVGRQLDVILYDVITQFNYLAEDPKGQPTQ